MKSSDIHQVLRRISSTGSRLEKEQIIKDNLADQDFELVLKAAYDPFTTYGVTGGNVSPLPEIGRGYDFDISTSMLLRQLRDRELTGQAAIDGVFVESRRLNYESAILLGQILDKDLRAGFTAGTINRVKPGTIPVFEVMLAHKYEEKRIKQWPVAVEPKKDGVRVICIVSLDGSGSVNFYSRTGKEFVTFDHLKPIMLQVVGMNESYLNPHTTIVFDGEVVSGSFNKTVSEVRRKSEQATDAWFEIFDMLTMEEFSAVGGDRPYDQRRKMLLHVLNDQDPRFVKSLPQVLASSHDEIQAAYADFRAQGFEGAIVKPLNGRYVKERSQDWLKLKGELTEKLRVVGAFEGTGKYVGQLGGLIVERIHGSEMVQVRVGGGFSDEQRVSFWDAYEHDVMEVMSDNKLLDRLIEVEAHEVTPDGSLRHPRFVRFRDDADPFAKAA